MKNSIILVIKGLIIGFGKIIPGVSGSVLAISLNVYEQTIKVKIKYLFFLGIGIITSITLGSKLLLYLFNNYYLITYFIIIGLIVGTIPSVLKKTKIIKFLDLIYFLFPFFLFYLCSLKITIPNSIIMCFIIGIIEAITTIVPGVSSTAIYISFGLYKEFLDIFSNFLSLKFLLFFLGILIGSFFTIKLINYLFKKYNNQTYLVILSLLLSSIVILLKNISISNNFFTFLFYFTVGFVISRLFDK